MPNNVTVCSKCGQPVYDPDAMFCTGCGSPLVTPMQQGVGYQNEPVQPMYVQPQEQVPKQPTYVAPQEQVPVQPNYVVPQEQIPVQPTYVAPQEPVSMQPVSEAPEEIISQEPVVEVWQESTLAQTGHKLFEETVQVELEYGVLQESSQQELMEQTEAVPSTENMDIQEPIKIEDTDSNMNNIEVKEAPVQQMDNQQYQNQPMGMGYQGQPMQGMNQNQPMGGGYQSQPMQGVNQNQPMGMGYQGQPMQGMNQNQPMGGGYQGQPMQGMNQNQPMGGGYQGQPMQGGYQGQPMGGGYQGQPMQNGYANPMGGAYPGPNQPVSLALQQPKKISAGMIGLIIGIIAVIGIALFFILGGGGYPNKPAQVAQKFVSGMIKDCNLKECAKYLSKENKESLGSDVQEEIESFKTLKESWGIKIEKVKAGTVEVSGNEARVTVSVTYKAFTESETQDFDVALIKEGGKWKVDNFY